ncbi:MAG TPA: hypothetical protein VF759_02290 [Allosphingosinicella sp.]|jgi:hypothetical protein
MANLVEHLALVSESERTSMSDLTRVSAALQKQATRDLLPIWDISATVDAFVRLEDVPTDYWPIIIMDNIGIPGVAGIHQDRNGQPFALVSSKPDIDEWSLTASHEVLEMLVDPFGRRLVAGDSIKPGQGRVDYLVEVCDPSEHAQFAYSVNGVLVSDFYTPHFFDPAPAPGVRYSYTGDIERPRQVLEGGYLSWRDTETGDWWQQTWFGGDAPEFRNLGPLTGSNNFRSQIDRTISRDTAAAVGAGRAAARLAGMSLVAARDAGASRAESLHGQIQELIAANA